MTYNGPGEHYVTLKRPLDSGKIVDAALKSSNIFISGILTFRRYKSIFKNDILYVTYNLIQILCS